MANFPVFHGISLAENSLIENLTIERLASDPTVLVAGRCWFNTTDKVLRIAGLDAGGGVITQAISTGESSATVLADANSYTDNALAAMVGSAPAVLDTLAEIAAALANDPNFATTIVSSVTTVSNAVGTLANLTTTAKTSLVAAVNELDGDISAEATTRAANDTTLQGNIDTEASTRASGDSNLQTQVGTLANLTTSSKTNLVVAVNELNTNIGTNATTAAQAVADEASARSTADSTEASARSSGDSALQNQIGTLGNLTTTDKATVVAAINEIVTNAGSEATTRSTADSTLTTNLATEVTNRTNADSAEVTARSNADTALQTQIGTLGDLTTTEKTNVVLAINELVAAGAGSGAANAAAILAEETARIAADGVLTTNLATEVTNRTNADTTLQGNIDTEASTRATADSTLTTNLATEVTNRTNADSTLTTNLATEVTDRTNADTTLQGNIDAEVTNRTTAVAGEASARTAAIAAETVVRVAAEAVIQGNVDAEATARATADGLRVLKIGDTMGGNLAFGGTHTVTGLVNPADPTDAATKAYVDSMASGLVWLDPITLINFTGSATSPVGSPVLYDSYLIGTGGATGTWAAFAVGDVVQCTNASGPVWTKVTSIAVGQHYIISGITETTPIGIAAGHLTEFATVTNATPGSFAMTFMAPIVGNASFVGEPGAALFGRSYTYAVDAGAPTGNPTHSWIQFGGPGSTGAGVGLVYAGNVLHVNLGAGIAQLPSDEVGVDLYATGGLMLTVDGTAASSDSASQLAIKLDGTTLTRGAGGLKVSSALTDELTAATTANGVETAARIAADSTLTTNLATEVTNRTSADTILQDNINAETTARTGADTTLQGNIDAEATARSGADTTLQTNITNEATARSGADTTLQGNIDAEATARTTADSTLTTDLAAEVTARTNADTTLTTNLASEVTNRTSADTLIRTDFATADNTVRSEFAAADTALQGVLQGNIDAEATARAGADSTLTTNLATEVTNRTNADTTLQGNIDAEATTRAGADTTLTNNLSTLSSTVTTFRNNVNASRFTFLAGAAAVQHTISHNLNSSFVDFTVLVQRDNGKFRNDVVSVEATDDNTLTVYLTESRVIKASVVALSNSL